MNHTKQFFLMLMLAIVSNVAAWGEEKTSTLSFTSACGGYGTADDGTVWTVTSDAPESTFDSTKGIHYGTGKVAVSYLTLTTNDISGTVSKIVVNASGASSTTAELAVTVGGSAFGSEVSLTGTATRYTFTGSASGEIVIKVSQSSAKKALYIKSVTVTYEKTSSTLKDLSAFEFADASPTINLLNETTYSQDVTVAPLDYDGDITYSLSDNTAGATISGSTVKVSQAGSVTVTASGTATDVYNKPADASYTLTVTDSRTKLYIKTGNDDWNPNVYTFYGDNHFTGDWPGTPATTLETVNGVKWHKIVVPSTDFNIVLSDGYGKYPSTGGIHIQDKDKVYLVYNSETDGTSNSYAKIVEFAEVTANNVNVDEGASVSSGVTAIPSGLSLSYSSSDESIATVSSDGTLTGVSQGTATITVSWNTQEVGGTHYVNGSTTFDAIVTESGSASNSSIYVRVTDASQLVAGKKYIIATKIQEGTPYSVQILGKQTNDNYRDKVGVATIQNNTEIDLSNPQAKDAVVLTLGGETGAWTFLASDNNKYLSLNSKSNYLQSSESVTSNSQKWTITSGFQVKSNYDTSRSIQYNSGGGTTVARFACYSSDLKAAYLYVQKNDNQVATPTFDPVAGEVEMGTEVTFNCSTEGVTYYYTTDGTEPTTSSASGSSYTVNSSVTLKVIAVKSGMENSEVATATYTIAKNNPNLAFSETNVTANIGESFTPPTLSYAEGYDGTITYSSSNSAITVNAETGEVSFDASAAGKTTTITATASETDNFSAGTTSYVLNVINPNAIEGNLNNETFGTNYNGSITPIGEFSSVSGNIGSVVVTYAKGAAEYAYINDSQIRMYNGSKLTFTAPDGVYILSLTFNTDLTDCSSDKGTISGNTWLPGDGENVNSVTITRGGSGNLQLSTVAITLSESGTAVQRPSISPLSGTQIDEKTQIKITSEEGTTIYYTTDGSDPVKDGALTGTAKAYTGAFTLSKAGTVKAVARDAEGNFSIIASATYKYNGTTVLPYYERFDAGLGNFITTTTGTVKWTYRQHTDQAFINKYGEVRKYAYCSNTGYDHDKTGKARFISPIIDLTEEGLSNVMFNFIHAGAYFSNSNMMKTMCKVQVITDDNDKDISDESVLAVDAYWTDVTIPDDGWFTYNDSQFTRKNSGDISLDDYVGNKVRICFLFDATDTDNKGNWNVDQISIRGELVEKVKITKPSTSPETETEGFTTYVTKNDIDAATTLTEKGVKLYKVVEFDKRNVVLVQLGLGDEGEGAIGENTYSETMVPAGSPVLVKGEFGDRELVLVNSSEVIPKLRGNLLRSAVEGVTATENDHFFVLQYPKAVGAYGFHLLGTGKTVDGRRAYLNGVDEVETLTTQTNSAKGVFLFGEEEDVLPLNIQQLDVPASSVIYNDGIYDLMGRKVNTSNGHLPKGIYVVKGKKFVVK